MRCLPLVVSLILLAAPAFAEDSVSHSFASAMPRGTVRRVIVDIPTGQVSIRNGTADRIRVSGDVEREYDDFRSRQKQQAIVDDIGAEIFVNGEEALVRRRFGPRAQGWSARSFRSEYRVTVEVPRGMDVEIETKVGELSIEGDFGNVSADLRAGEIRLRMPRASVRELNASARIGEVHTDFGESYEDHEGIFPGTTHFVNVVGRSRVNVHTTVGELHITLTR